ncbi:UDP-glucose:glycoprotein glucosyltransferase 1 [Penicillium diatomitis]|uniref:UDP-glucose:glycoprotein glucosyltransferase 1 n=1 Tax=Penicillium diatomitis TaxID=2819901 RepID=A0A9X0BZI3_9EURO|nr:UDP-glucose:glycoprotein glucosyltransferase 1 [Penicillium diatomitis]KAJ5492577.1 UDP-glucose:glycoprotein glucosyltransferase 1 [Penicillium diatomitis]
MKPSTKSRASWHWLATLGTVLPLCLAQANPEVNVALQASFDSSPYLVELLETAAEENKTSYFPLLDRIADGAFEEAVSEKELYDRFLQVIHEDGHLRTPESLSSFKLSMAIRSSAPRIQAHYQYYNTSVQQSLMVAQDAACPVWVHLNGKQYCSSLMERAQQDVNGDSDPKDLPFDRVFGDESLPPAVLYADISAPTFKEFHEKISEMARQGDVSYRVRYRPPQHWVSRPLFVSGYGVELALKRTDYIVIDDRDAERLSGSNSDNAEKSSGELKEDATDTLRPLSASELSRLGLNTASYVMDSENPLETLLRLSQDFPKYSTAIAAHNASEELRQEIHINRGRMIPAGYNVMWINGMQIDERQIDAFSLLEVLRRERKLIEKFRSLGLSAQETVKLLSHKALAESQAEDQSPRYDYRDTTEGKDVILWLNDLEHDSRYETWSSALDGYIANTYPGQLPRVRRDLHNVVFPVDLSVPEDVLLVVNQVQTFIKRLIPIRFGLVPTASSPNAVSQLKVAHYLYDTFGVEAFLHYLQEMAAAGKSGKALKGPFNTATKERKPILEKQTLSFDRVMKSEIYESATKRSSDYQRRLGLVGSNPPLLVNGVPVSREGNWMQELSMLISRDLKIVQQGIAQGILTDDASLPEYILTGAFERRNTMIMPEDPKSVRIVDLATIFGTDPATSAIFPRIPTAEGIQGGVHVIVVGDFETESGLKLLTDALAFRNENEEIELLLVHNSASQSEQLSSPFNGLQASLSKANDIDHLLDLLAFTETAQSPAEDVLEVLGAHRLLAKALGFEPGTEGLIVNGRAVGPIPVDDQLSVKELHQLVSYERSKRIEPVIEASLSLGLDKKLTEAIDIAKLTSMAALSAISNVPAGIFESVPDFRMNVADKWMTEHSIITVSNSDDPAINVGVVVDPASETAQKWLPILRVLSELAGVQMKIFLNPKDELKELPIKRFYRYVLDSEPSFTGEGALVCPGASFKGTPVDALLTLGMDVPSSWLVAPKESIYDPDNIKLSTLKPGSNVDAIYALEHILIEGHSRDTTTESPPRGVQLVLGTENDPHFADTIIMANLGYFQFKAQPGVWQINLKPGRSDKIFKIDSVGGLGHRPQPGDEVNEVTLLSFQGLTLFPRLSRKPGHEDDDVLETGPQPGSTRDYLSKGLNFASGVLSSVGVGSKSEEKHADINIFSVASGHLYERMLNIMMVSVMRHTKHTVKFWFIEQFLSPSFRAFLPHLAEEYGFTYEMVTYKWPHWLRPQKEKQREIWGYKMLFLDVLFPLSLDKVIFVDADQIVRTDMYELVTHDLEGAPYGFTPMGDSRTEMEGFRFWKQGYWSTFLRGKPYHISALYVVDLNRFRALAAGDRLRGQYQMLSADPNSLSNLDQDLPNHMQHHIPIHSLPQEWLWCETWCSDEDLATARTIDLCNNPMTKEPKLARARRQVPEWTVYDDEIAALAKRVATEQVGFVQTGEDAAQKVVMGDQEEQSGENTRKDEL